MLPLQDIIEKYYNDDALMLKSFEKIARYDAERHGFRGPYREKDTNIVLISKSISENHKVHKATFSFYFGPYHSRRFMEVKVYELLFVSYPDLSIDAVIELVEGFRKFLVNVCMGQSLIESRIYFQKSLLLLNENLSEELKLWLELDKIELLRGEVTLDGIF